MFEEEMDEQYELFNDAMKTLNFAMTPQEDVNWLVKRTTKSPLNFWEKVRARSKCWRVNAITGSFWRGPLSLFSPLQNGRQWLFTGLRIDSLPIEIFKPIIRNSRAALSMGRC